MTAGPLDLGGAVGTLSPEAGYRLVEDTRESIDRVGLDLEGLNVGCEAATGYFSVLPVIAALAGANVWAVPADNRFGSSQESIAAVNALSSAFESGPLPIRFIERDQLPFADLAILTNSASVRPIDEQMVAELSADSVVALMYEAWELRPGDVAIETCRQRGVRVVAVDEHHRLIDSFKWCGPLATKLVTTAGVSPSGRSVLVVGSDPFAPVVAKALESAGGRVVTVDELDSVDSASQFDAVVHTDLVPSRSISNADGWQRLAASSPDAVVAQFTGGLPYDFIASLGLSLYPAHDVPARTMGWSLAAQGSDPVVRLFAGGLKAAVEVLRPSQAVGVAQVVVAGLANPI